MDSKFNPDERYGTIDGGGSRLYVRFGEGKNDVAPMKRLEIWSIASAKKKPMKWPKLTQD